MNKVLAETTEVVTTSTLSTWVNAPMIVALIFALAGAFFIAVYTIRRIRSKSVADGSALKP